MKQMEELTQNWTNLISEKMSDKWYLDDYKLQKDFFKNEIANYKISQRTKPNVFEKKGLY